MFTSVIRKIKGKTAEEASSVSEDAIRAADPLKTGMIYLWASIAVAIAAAVYGLFSHGVYSYYMTYAFMVPLLVGAVPHLTAALRNGTGERRGLWYERLLEYKDVQLAIIVTLTAGSIMKGVLDIYGTTNRLLIGYPVLALLVLIAGIAAALKKKPAAE